MKSKAGFPRFKLISCWAQDPLSCSTVLCGSWNQRLQSHSQLCL